MGGAFRLFRIQITRSSFFPVVLSEKCTDGRIVRRTTSRRRFLVQYLISGDSLCFSPGKASKTHCSISKGSNNAQLLTDADTESLVFPYLSAPPEPFYSSARKKGGHRDGWRKTCPKFFRLALSVLAISFSIYFLFDFRCSSRKKQDPISIHVIEIRRTLFQQQQQRKAESI